MQNDFRRFKVNEIWKGGSLGHGTVVPGHYDIDLVLYSDGNMATFSIILVMFVFCCCRHQCWSCLLTWQL